MLFNLDIFIFFILMIKKRILIYKNGFLKAAKNSLILKFITNKSSY